MGKAFFHAVSGFSVLLATVIPVPASATTTEPPPSLALVAELISNADEDGSGETSVGDTLTVVATATNLGADALTNVVVSAVQLTPESAVCEVLASADTCVASGTYVVTTGDVEIGSIVIATTATSHEGEVTEASVTLPVPDEVAEPTTPLATSDEASTTTTTSIPLTVPSTDLPESSKEPPGQPETAGGSGARYLVTFADSVPSDEQRAALTAFGTDVTSIPQLNMHKVSVPEQALQGLANHRGIVDISEDVSRSRSGVPSDTEYPNQWSLPVIGWDLAYETITPSGTALVAILDTGISGSHPDLGNVIAGTSVLDGSNGLTDPNGHGTALAGVVAATSDNATGIAGVGYDGVTVLPVTVLDSSGTGWDSDTIEGILYAVDRGADVILMAFSAPGYSEALQAAVDYAWDAGIVVVAAVGNDGSSATTFPAGMAGVIGVSNSDQTDSLHASSNFGDAVFLAAPGTAIVTTDSAGGYRFVTGTSAAAAAVAGAAALIAANDPGASNSTIVHRLAANAEDVGTRAETGNGRLNLYRALNDDSEDAAKPAGVEAANGGPYVGPYEAALTVTSANPLHTSVNTATQFTADSNGVTWSLVTNNTGGNITSDGIYTSGGTPGFDTVRVTKGGNLVDVPVSVVSTANSGDITIEITSQDTMWVDANKCDADGPRGAWISYVITNTSGSDLTEVVVTFDDIAGGTHESYFVIEADLTRTIGTLAAGESVVEYFYVDYGIVCDNPAGGGTPYTGFADDYTLTVASPDLTSSEVVAGSIISNELLTATAAGTADSITLGSGTYVGQIFEAEITYSFGNNNDLFFQPGIEAGFLAKCYRLVDSEITGTSASVSGVVVGERNRLHYPDADVPGGGGTITVKYYWLILCNDASQTATPWAAGRSGTKYKYTSVDRTSLVTIDPLPAPLTIEKSASQDILADDTEGPVTYTVTISNPLPAAPPDAPIDIIVDSITDVLPPCMTIADPAVTGSDVTAANSSSTPAVSASDSVAWVGKSLGTDQGTSYVVPASGTLTLIYSVTVTGCADDTHSNSVTASVGAETIGPAVAPVAIGGGFADLDLTKSASDPAPLVGSDVTFEITVTNRGPLGVTEVTVVDLLPSGYTYVSDSPSAGTYASGTGIWSVGGLLDGGLETLQIVATVLETGEHDNYTQIASSSAPDPDSTPGDDSVGDDDDATVLVVPQLAADLGVAKSDDVDPILAGDTLTYTITVSNAGPSNAHNVVATDTLPAGLTFVSTSGCAEDPSGVATCSLGTIAPGGEDSYTITVTTDGGLAEGTVLVNSVTVTSDAVDSNAANDTATESTTVSPTPSLDLVKSLEPINDDDASGDISVGDTLTYRLVATNDGTANLTNVTIADPLTGLSALTCTPTQPATLEPESTLECTATYVVTAADVTTGTVQNTATATSDQTPDDTATLNTPIPTPSLDLVKSLEPINDDDASGDISVGDTLTYRLVATNDGTANLTNVTITDPLTGLSALTCTPTQPATLEPESTLGCTATYVVTTADVTTGTVQNTATATSDQTPDDTATLNTPIPTPSLDLVKSLEPINDDDASGDISVGDTLTYRLVATNDGTANLTNVTIADPLTGLSALTCTPTQPATLEPESTLGCTATYVVTAADVTTGTVQNTATATSDQTPDDTATLNTPIPTPSLNLVKSLEPTNDDDASGDISVGDTLTYRLVATNDGTANLTNVTITDPLTGLSALTCTPTQPATLEPESTLECTATYVVTAADVTTGTVQNTATATSDQTPDDTATLNTPIPTPSLNLVKSLEPINDDDASGDISVGDTLTYRLVATNDGTANLTNVTITDPLTGLSALTCTPTQPATLEPESTLGCTATYVVTTADVTTGTVQNTATATSDQTPDDTATLNTPIPTPSLNLVKSLEPINDDDASGDISVGDTLTYRLVATNDGTANLTNVTIADPLTGLSALTCTPTQPATLEPESTLECTATYVVTAADVTTGTVQNTATATSDQTPDDTATLNTPIPTPSLDLVKSLEPINDDDASGDISVGDTLTYRLVATNDGTANLTNVTITDPLTGLSALTCTPTQPATLEPESTLGCTATYVVTTADVITGTVQNTATATSDQTPDDTATLNTPIPTPSLDLVKSLEPINDDDASGDISVGDTLTYRLVATNDGTANLTNVTITDPLTGLSALTCTPTQPATLEPESTLECTATYVVTTADVTTGTVQNTATATSDQTPDDTATLNTPIPTPSLDLVKSLEPTNDDDASGDISVGDTLTYRLVATNDGTANLTNVTIADPLTGLSALTCTPTQPATLEPESTLECTATYVVTAADVTTGTVQNTATATSDQTPDDTATLNTPIPTPSLDLVKSLEPINDDDASGDISVGDTLTYRLVATNDGTANLTNVTITDPLTGLSALTCTPTQPATLEPESTLGCTATYVVTTADVTTGTVQNTATATSDQTPDDTATLNTPIPTPSLDLVKSLEPINDDDASGDISVGDTLTYRLVATNDGTANLTNVTIADPLTGLSALSCTPTQPATLEPESTLECTATYVVTAADVTTGTVQNTATATSDQTPDDTATLNTPIPTPSLDLVKSLEPINDDDASGDISVGDTLTYRLVATNDGTANLTNVTIADPLTGLSALTCTPTQPATLGPGSTLGCTATYVVTAADVITGTVQNTATATSDQTPDDTATLNTPIPTPSLDLVKSLEPINDDDASGDISVGDTLTYRLVATNDGTANLTNVTIADPLTGLSALTCTPTQPATLEPESTLECTATYVVTAADVTTGTVQNTATATSDQTPDDTATLNTPIPTPSLNLVKSLEPINDDDASGDISVGDTLTYRLVATNDGTANLTNVTITDPLTGLSALTCTPTQPATLEPESTLGCTATYVVTTADVTTGTVQNTATATSDQTPDDTATLNTPIPTPSLNLVKFLEPINDDDASGDISVGDTLTYRLVATNDGTANLTNVTIADPLTGLSALTCTPTQPATLEPESTLECTATYVVTTADVTTGTVQNTATATSDQTPDDTATLNTPIPTPSLDLVKSLEPINDDDASGDISVGDTLTYRLVATNDGTANLTNVTITDPLTGLSALTCTPTQPATLEPESTLGCTATYVVTTADVTTGTVQNTATATSDQTPDDTATLNTPIPTPSLDLVKSLEPINDDDASGDISVGDTLTYRLVATNDGTANLTNVTIADPLTGLSALSCTPTQPATLEPESTLECTATYVVTAADVTTGTVQNTATATSDQTPDDTATLNTPIPTPSLDLVKSLEPINDDDASGDISVGDTLTYRLVATNDGTANLTNVTIADPLTGLSALTCTPTQPATLGPGSTLGCTATYVVTAADVITGTVQNTATATSDQTPDDTATLNTPIPTPVPVADLSIDKSAPASVVAGEQLTYAITASNSGPSAAVDVSVIDVLPVGVSYVSDTGGCVESPSGTLTCDVGTVVSGDSVEFMVTVLVGADVADGATIVNAVTVSSPVLDPDPSDDEETAETPVDTEADLSVSKVADVEAQTAGGSVVYTVTVTNAGPSDAQGVVVADTLPVGVTLVATNGCVEDPVGVPSCSLATVPAGGSAEFTVEVTVNGDVEAGTVISSTVLVASNTLDPAPDNDTDTEDIDVGEDVFLEVDKDFLGSNPIPGSTGQRFRITVTNTGLETATNVNLVDVVDSDLTVTNVSPSPGCDTSSGQTVDCTFDLAAGASFTVDVTYSVGPDVDPGPVVGTATATDDNGHDASGSDTVTIAEEALPVTGMETNRILWFVVILVGLGVVLTGLTRRQRDETSAGL